MVLRTTNPPGRPQPPGKTRKAQGNTCPTTDCHGSAGIVAGSPILAWAAACARRGVRMKQGRGSSWAGVRGAGSIRQTPRPPTGSKDG